MDHVIEILDRIETLFQHGVGGRMLAALLVMIVGWAVASLVARLIQRTGIRLFDDQQVLLARRIVYWGILVVASLSALRELGFNPTVLLGTAGVLTVALGFAAQTSASNLISGLFLVSERAIAVGDRVRVDNVLAEVVSIDTLSVKVRTLDNLLMRIPNETMLKSTITTMNRYPVRRFDLPIGVAYRTDLAKAREVLLETAGRNPLVLEQPEPSVLFLGFGDNAMTLRLSAWAVQDRFFEVYNFLPDQVKAAFDEAGIEIAFPQRTLHVPDRIRIEGLPGGGDRVAALSAQRAGDDAEAAGEVGSAGDIDGKE